MNRGGPTLTEARRAELGYGPRMTLRLTAEAYTLLESLAERLGLPRATVIAQALAAFSAGQKSTVTHLRGASRWFILRMNNDTLRDIHNAIENTRRG